MSLMRRRAGGRLRRAWSSGTTVSTGRSDINVKDDLMPQTDSKYRIAFLMNGAKPPRGGEFLIHNLIVRLDRQRFHPVVIYAEEGRLIKRIKEAGIDSIQVPLSGKIASLFPGEVLRNPFKLTSVIFNYLRSMHIFKLIRALKARDVDLIYSADSLSKISGGISGRWLAIKVIAHCHNDFEGPLFRNMLGRFLKFIDISFLDAIIAVSGKVRVCFAKDRIFPNVKMIYNGVDADIFDPRGIDDGITGELDIPEGALKIGIIGTIEKIKGHVYLIEAIGMLKGAGINCVALVCGTGPEEMNIRKAVRDKSLDKEVLFLGSREEMPGVLKVLDILAVPSLHESFSMAAVEAMSMEVPVIAARVGGLPEVVEDGVTGVLVPPGDSLGLYKAIRRLAEDPELRQRLGKNGRQRVLERFTIDENVRRTEEVFLELLEAKG